MTAWSERPVAPQSRRLEPEEYSYLQTLVAKRYPLSAIAKMMGRPLAWVRPLVPPAEGREPEPVVVSFVPLAQAKAAPNGVGIPDRAALIMERIAEAHGIAPSELRGENTSRKYVRPRHEAMYELMQLGVYSAPQVGRFFNRDHTTVLHAVSRVEGRIAAAFASEAVQ